MLRKRPATTTIGCSGVNPANHVASIPLTTPIDESEQEKIVASLRAECIQQISSSWNVLITACRIAAVTSALSVPLFMMFFHLPSVWSSDAATKTSSSSSSEEPFSQTEMYITIAHSAYATVVHLTVAEFGKKEVATINADCALNGTVSSYPSAAPTNKNMVLPFHIFGFLCALLPLLTIIFEVVTMNVSIQIVLSLFIGNIITLGASMILYLDGKNTLDSLVDLDSSRYQFKSL